MHTRPDPKPPRREKKTRRPLSRKHPMRKRAPRRLARGEGDPAYMAFVRTLPCAVAAESMGPGFILCEGRMHAHHAVNRARGGKDDTCIPLCDRHHSQWHGATGVFRFLGKLQRFAWSMKQIAATQAAWKVRGA
jgi:hypothetical protein